MFCWVDLRAWLPGEGWAAEEELWRRLTYDHLLLLTPGASVRSGDD